MRTDMECFYLIANNMKDRDLKISGTISDFFERNGKRCIVHAADTNKHGFYTQENTVPDEVDCIVVLGGDGTLIQAAHDMINRNIPLLGVNLGTLGFLADVEVEGLLPSLQSLLDGEYEIEERMMLDGMVMTSDGVRESVALNDIVINRYGRLRIIEYKLYVNGRYLCSYRADGVIVSTPTGSTGYSLSAGGPIVEPRARMMVITPICPHTLNTRSIVLSAEDRVRIETVQGSQDVNRMAETTFDGRDSIVMGAGDSVCIAASQKTTKIVRIHKESFVTILGRKFKD